MSNLYCKETSIKFSPDESGIEIRPMRVRKYCACVGAILRDIDFLKSKQWKQNADYLRDNVMTNAKKNFSQCLDVYF